MSKIIKFTVQKDVEMSIDELANKFMGIKIPKGVCPDYINDDGYFNENATGTNMIDTESFKKMLEELFSDN